ncbi:hypothetical protein nbrc107696_23670 [Gordonia spumicola]|uniref:Uncharacterized protein n=1 Tax=Gordonia spumicola TaxID=589161 RepID=A0A7I9V9Z3_9ACTN|nr:hypothetical protein [Gordonia spumicola]GEE01921.1 hypothetical protein nbrc107696_23670 [Gordonia spumicola]
MTEQSATDTPLRRSPGLAVMGVLALLVAGWGLADGPSIDQTHTLPWALLAVGVIVGLGLVASGFRRR